jgi:VIT1/CCC1 family predicted Fe2+/Mn2+ transporter
MSSDRGAQNQVSDIRAGLSAAAGAYLAARRKRDRAAKELADKKLRLDEALSCFYRALTDSELEEVRSGPKRVPV